MSTEPEPPNPSTTGNSTSLSSRDPDQVSKAELLDVLQKMSKHVKVLSNARLTLLERIKVVEHDKLRLLSLFKEEVLSDDDLLEAAQKMADQREKVSEHSPTINKEENENIESSTKVNTDDIDLIQLAWKIRDERNRRSTLRLSADEMSRLFIDTAEASTSTNLNGNDIHPEEAMQRDSVTQRFETLEMKHADELQNLTNRLAEQHRIDTTYLNRKLEEMEGKDAMMQEALKQITAELEETKNALSIASSNLHKLDEIGKTYAASKNLAETKIEELNTRLRTREEYCESLLNTLEDTNLEHQKNIDTMTVVLQQNHSSEIDALQESHRVELAKIVSEADDRLRSALDQVMATHAAELERTRQDYLNSLMVEQEKSAVASKAQHELDIEQLRVAWENEHMLQLERVTQMASSDVQMKLDNLRDDMNKKHREELDAVVKDVKHKLESKQQDVTDQLKAIHMEEIERLKSSYESEVNQYKDQIELSKRHLLEIENQVACNATGTTSSVEELQQLKTNNARLEEELRKYESELSQERSRVQELTKSMHVETEALREELTKKIATDSERILKDSEENLRRIIQEMANDKEAGLRTLQENLEAAHSLQLVQLRNDLLADKEQLEENFNTAREALHKIAKINEDATRQIDLLHDEVAALKESQQRLDEEKEAIKCEYEKKLESLSFVNRDLEAKLLVSQEKLNKAVDVGRKLKESAQKRLNSLEEEKATTLKQYELKIDALQNENNTLLSQVTSSTVEKEALARLFETHISDLKTEYEKERLTMRLRHDEELAQVEATLKACVEEEFKQKIEIREKECEASLAKLSSELNENEKRLKTLNDLADSFKSENENLHLSFKSEVAGKDAMRQEMIKLKEELEETLRTSSATVASLLEHQDQLTREKDKLIADTAELRKTLMVYKNNNDELQLKLRMLTSSLDALTVEKQELEIRLEATSKLAAKLNIAETELNIVREELNRWKLEQAKTSGLLSRLQSEKDASERRHGQSTALVGMLEAQLVECNEKYSSSQAKLEAALYELNQKDDELKVAKSQLEKTEESLMQLQSSRHSANETTTNTLEKELSKKTKLVEVLQKEVQSLQQQMSKRSSAAQKLLQERESECHELRKKNRALQDEIDNGSLSDRRIFELAALQSTRDTKAAVEIEVREKMLKRLTDSLAERDGHLAYAECVVRQSEAQVEDLCRTRRRDDINIDYLKSVVVQYLSKPPGSSERNTLLPVLATLLQFDANDYKIIEEGRNKTNWFGQVLPTFITSPLENESRTSSV